MPKSHTPFQGNAAINATHQRPILQKDSSQILDHIINRLLFARSLRLLWRNVSRRRLDLFQNTLANSAAESCCINALGMTAASLSAINTAPHIFVVDFVSMFCGHLDYSTVCRVIHHRLLALAAPLLEASSVRVVVDVGNHEVCKVAVFMSESVDQANFIVDDSLRQLNIGVVFGWHGRVFLAHCPASFPVRSSSRLLKRFAPDDLDSPRFCG